MLKTRRPGQFHDVKMMYRTQFRTGLNFLATPTHVAWTCKVLVARKFKLHPKQCPVCHHYITKLTRPSRFLSFSRALKKAEKACMSTDSADAWLKPSPFILPSSSSGSVNTCTSRTPKWGLDFLEVC